MGWLNKNKDIPSSDFTLMLVRFVCDFKQIYKILDELLPDAHKDLRKNDRVVVEILLIRLFVVTKLTNLLIDKKVAEKILDDLHSMIFSAIETSDLKIDLKQLPLLLNDRYEEYYRALGNIEKDKDKNGSSSFILGTVIAAHILDMDTKSKEFHSIDPKLAMDCYIDFISLYTAEEKVFSKIKRQIRIG